MFGKQKGTVSCWTAYISCPHSCSDTQPAVYFLFNRKWTSFCWEDWGWVVNLADLVPNTTFIYPEAGFAAILTSDWQKILTLKTPPACLHSKHMPFYFQPDLLNFFNMGGVEKCALEMGHYLSLISSWWWHVCNTPTTSRTMNIKIRLQHYSSIYIYLLSSLMVQSVSNLGKFAGQNRTNESIDKSQEACLNICYFSVVLSPENPALHWYQINREVQNICLSICSYVSSFK